MSSPRPQVSAQALRFPPSPSQPLSPDASEAPLTHRCPRRTGLMTVPAESGCLSPHAAPIPRAAPHGG